MKNNLLVLSLLFAVSCSPGPEKEKELIATEEQQLMSDSSLAPDSARAAALCARYVAFAEKFRNDSLAPEFLFRAADLSQGIGNFNYSLRCYDSLLAAHPVSPKAPAALFMRAFLFDQRMGAKDEAIKAYSAFLNAYPDHPLAGSAEVSRMQLQTGMSDEDLIKSFELRLDSAKQD
ncbi:MAG: tetratricopeptide repeat protein [Bacteroidota bacterium]